MAPTHLNLIYALKDREIVHISEVERGLKCECSCPACGERLVAKKGQRMTHHFAHQAARNCEYGYESSLHLAAKDILSKAGKMVIPPVYVQFPNSYKESELIYKAKEITFDRVQLEQKFNNLIPDIVVYAGGKRLFIEIFVTHRIDEEKLDKLKKANISTIEIDLSKIDHSITAEELTALLIEENEAKYWKYNSIANKYLEKFYQAADKRNITSKEYALQVYGCPIEVRSWRGKAYADFEDDCLSCEYCISYSLKNGILCSGRQRISTIQDFSTPKDIRIKQSKSTLIARRHDGLLGRLGGKCPYCGSHLVIRMGNFGLFQGCGNYPHCRFTAPY